MKLTLSLPVTPVSINQPFGNPDPKYRELGLPGHNGIDFLTYHGQPVYAPFDGKAYYEIDDHGGHGVVITTNEQFEYNDRKAYFKVILWHLCDYQREPHYRSPVVGSTYSKRKDVGRGDIIGYADNTGYSTGTHLHFGIKPVSRNGANLEQDNGYAGAIDPAPYLKSDPYYFYRELEKGMSGDDVHELQRFLNGNGFVITASGPGSPGQETYLFGGLTVDALKRFQKAKGIRPQSGYFGPLTRNVANRMLIG